MRTIKQGADGAANAEGEQPPTAPPLEDAPIADPGQLMIEPSCAHSLSGLDAASAELVHTFQSNVDEKEALQLLLDAKSKNDLFERACSSC